MVRSGAPLAITVVGWPSHNQMFDEISADLRAAGHGIVRHQDREAFARTPDPLAATDVLLCVGNCPVTKATLASAPRLRAIVSAVTGLDGIDVAAASEHGVLVANAQTEENVIGMAEATILLILAALYDFNDTQDRLRKSLPRPIRCGRGSCAVRRWASSASARSAGSACACSRRGARACCIAHAAMPTSPACRRSSGSISIRCCEPATWWWC
jgi:lactate dehydrogenase-like 2-hydroxyacid dehydrogenase